jgi:hypothetical protein
MERRPALGSLTHLIFVRSNASYGNRLGGDFVCFSGEIRWHTYSERSANY